MPDQQSQRRRYANVYVHTPADIPLVEHWAIFEGSSVTIPGDERSRTNPGHGYPESTERFVNYEAWLDKEDFERELEARLSSIFSKEIRAAKITPLTITRKVTVDV